MKLNKKMKLAFSDLWRDVLNLNIKRVPHTIFEYDFFVIINDQETRVASLREQLVGTSKMFFYIHFPQQEYSRIVLDLEYHTHSEVMENAKRIIRKKMYIAAQDIINGLK